MASGDQQRYPAVILRTASDYAWRLLVLAGAFYVVVRVLSGLTTVVIPFLVALLLCALLQPLTARLQRVGVPRALATAITVVLAVVAVAGVLFLVIDKAIAQAPQFGDQINRLIPDVEHWLERGPFKVSAKQINTFSTKLSNSVTKNTSALASAALSTGKTVADVLTGVLLALFSLIFLIYDGRGIWEFLTRAIPRPGRQTTDRAGRAAWATLTHYMRGTLVVAAFHGVVIAVTLLALGVPLVAPLALIVALGSFVPLVGAVVAGVLAAGVATVEQGVVAGVIVVIVLVIDNQVEAHLLQPFVVGRYIHVHPLAVVLALATGALAFGIFGAIIAVPTMACINSAVRAGLGVPEQEDEMEPERVPEPPAATDPPAPVP
ncbi:MAG TPA: AI-2E family transporter [Acidimicrobiales bacterium]|nr:AI-2E family transporter [Acidimicrobiales bacterium]